MRLPRWLSLFAALVLVSGSTCRGTSDPGENKPAASPEVSLKGVDTSTLTPRERRELTTQVSELLAPCPETPVSIAQCIQEQRPCKTCLPAAQFLLKQVRAGRTKKEREEAFIARFDPKKVRTVVTEGSPEMGPADAPVTLVEWADFECPTCRAFYPLLEGLMQRFPGQVRLVYKFYPLSAHPHGEQAARAAVAAMNQGKFWPMHHLLFDNQDRLEQADLERYAKELRLDLPKFRADMQSEDTTARIRKDRAQADGIGLTGTPMLFINSREASIETLANPYEDLEDWVKLDIELAGKTPAPPPKDSAARAQPSAPPPSFAGSAAPAAASASAGPEPRKP
jgi:protein-disulfide isomerase